MAKPRKRESGVGVVDREQQASQAAAPQSAGDTTAANGERDRVAARAYELYLARGGRDGDALEDWLAAERELRGSTNQVSRDSDPTV